MAQREIKSQYFSRCRECRKWIGVDGTEVLYDSTKRGVRHLTDADCFSALDTLRPTDLMPAATGPIEYWSEYERVGLLLESQTWTFAKSMPDIPHCWSIRPSLKPGSSWSSDAEFETAILRLRQYGRQRRWRSPSGKSTTNFHKMDVNEHYYWTCAPPLSPVQLDGCINRAVRSEYESPPLPYSADWPESVPVAVDTSGLSVLDVGGLWPEASTQASSYVAIGAPGDLSRLIRRAPAVSVVNTLLRGFVPREPRRFDVVAAMYGAVLAMDDYERLRLPMLAALGGLVVVMVPREQAIELTCPPMQWTEMRDSGEWVVALMRVST